MTAKPRKTTPPPDAPAAPAQADAPLHAPTHNIWLAGLGALASAQANACSRPPDPIRRIFMRRESQP